MLTKAIVLGSALVTAPLLMVAAPQDAGAPARSTAASLRDDGQLRALRAELREARAEVQALRGELEEALDLLDASIQPGECQRRNCTPSRAALSYYQWLKQRDHDARAERTLDRYVEGLGDDCRRLLSLARELLIDDEHAGRFDQAALALVQRAQRRSGTLSHRDLDTAALAHFLTGDFAAAVALQRQASTRSRGSDDYRRRLRTYEAALARIGGAGDRDATRVAVGGD